MITRKPFKKKANLLDYRGMTDDQLLELGEPCYVQIRPMRPLIKALGPGTFWRMKLTWTPDGLVAVGRALDPEGRDSLNEALDMRRAGHIFGRWYSQVIPDGEMGFNHFVSCEEISEKDFDGYVFGFQRSKNGQKENV